MKTLNLVYPEKSDIKFNISNFPDGQQDCTIVTPKLDLRFGQGLTPTIVKIKSRFNSFKDLELIICATKSLRNLGVKEIHLYIPYLLGARSDRKFVEGGNSYLVEVISPILNSLNFESVTVMDVHSDVAAACLKNLKVIDNADLVRFALDMNNRFILNKPQLTREEYVNQKCILISPDAGSLKKIYKVAEAIGYKGDIVTCSKDRDVDGKLTKTVVPKLPVDKDIIVIDDICDGGATFINIAKEIGYHQGNGTHKKYLIVTHGIFSKGFEELSKYFDGIYCTNSYSDTLKGSYFNYDTKDIVKQLNVF